MLPITLSLGLVDVMFWMLMIMIILLSVLATFINETAIPILWGGTLVAILFVFMEGLSPILFGFFIHGWTFIGIVFLVLLLSWIALVILGMYNNIRYGKPWS